MTQTQEPNQDGRTLYFAREYIKPEFRTGANNGAVQLTFIQTPLGSLYARPLYSKQRDRNMTNKEIYYHRSSPAEPLQEGEEARRVYEGISWNVWDRLRDILEKRMIVVEHKTYPVEKIYSEDGKTYRYADEEYPLEGFRISGVKMHADRASADKAIRSYDKGLVMQDALGKGRTLVKSVVDEYGNYIWLFGDV